MEKTIDVNTLPGNLSLSGKPGIYFGIISIGFSYFINFLTNQYASGLGVSMLPISFFELLLIIVSLLFLTISYLVITFSNKKKRKKLGVKGWDSNSKLIRKVFVFAFLLFCVATFILYKNGLIKYVFPLSLCFYGLACIVVKKLTQGATFLLGLFFIAQAFLCLIQPDIMILIWGISFGLAHIAYGILGTKKIIKQP